MRQFHLAQARVEDFEAVAALFEALHCYNAELDSCFALSDNWQPLLADYFRRTWDDPQVLWLLAWQASHPVGLLIVKAHTDTPLFQYRNWTELMAIYVSPFYRGTSLGKQLVMSARAWTVAHGYNRLQLYVTATNEQARNFYRRCGLRPVQEIWRLDIDPMLAKDGSPDAAEDIDMEFLEPGHHFMGGDPQG